MRTVSLATLRSRLLWRADVGNENQRFPVAEQDDCINEGIAKFHSEVVRADGQGVFDTDYAFMTVNGTETYSLPGEFLDVKTVKLVRDGVTRTLEVYSELDVDWLASPMYATDGWCRFYRLRGDNISIMPVTDAPYAVTVRYTPTAVRLVAPSNTLDGIDGCEEYVVAWAAQRFAIKNRDWELQGVLEGVKAESLDQMRALVVNRNAAEGERVQDHGRKLVGSLRGRAPFRRRWP